MDTVLLALGYMVVGLSLTSFLWWNSGNDMTPKQLLAIIMFAAVWPVIGIVVAVMAIRDADLMNVILWKRKS